MTEKIGNETQLQRGHAQQDGAGHQRQQHGGGDIVGTARGEQRLQRRGGHQRDHRHRPHGQGVTGAEQGIQQQRQHTGIEPGDRRQPGEHGIGQALGYQHQGDNNRRQCILAREAAVVTSQPAGAG